MSSLDEAVAAVEAAVSARDIPQLEAGYEALRSVPRDEFMARSPEMGPRLAGLLSGMPVWHASVYAVAVGALVEWQADATACAPAILDGLRDSLAGAVEFARLWHEKFADEELPDPHGMPSADVQDPAWHTVDKWEMASVAVLADARVRRAVTNRAELLALIDQLEPDYGSLACVQRALLLLDDEPLLVLDRASGRAFRMRMSGIADNFQLQTMMAGVLIGGGHLPGEAPSPEALALCTADHIDVNAARALPPTSRAFNFVTPAGQWIWSEGVPSDIPVVDGIRRLVLDPPPYQHSFGAGRFFPRVPGRLDLEAVLEPADAAPYFADVQEALSVTDSVQR
ncbi:hypothetical protein [Kutzneria chonburiensis]|uniref:Uncharacterized protein n=1 Tax=Kutzneria chonburiensis TaxID=1483604 RepID=A0ABV6MZ58_9PSEU|nr:hypothetical protein [Kutzneria chonburiensis]